MKSSLFTLTLLAGSLPLFADTQFQIRRMTRDDVPFGKGQCDIRLRIDQEAEVSVNGSTVRIRNLRGRGGWDDGSECNYPLPDRPNGFRFDVRDENGDIALVEAPSPRNHGTAVVRIRDRQGGAGRYHFRLTWALSGSFDDRDGRPGRGGYNSGNGRGPGSGHNDGRFDPIDFRGRGDGSFERRGNRRVRLGDVAIDIDRGGRVRTFFEAERYGRLSFAGTIVRTAGDKLYVEIARAGGNSGYGEMVIDLDSGRRVGSIRMKGRIDNDPMELEWRR